MIDDSDPRLQHRHGWHPAPYGESPNGLSRSGDRHATAVGSVQSSTPYPATPPYSGSRGRRWPLLADDMFRLAHRDSDGASLLDPQVAGLGLSAALLGELLLTGHLTLREGPVEVLNAAAPSDVLAHTVLDQLVREQAEHPVRTWLAYLGRDAYAEVAGRMERAGHVHALTSRRVFARTVRYVPTDMNAAAWPWARLAGALRRGDRLGDFDTLLGGFAVATDLHRVVLIGDASNFALALRPLIAEAAPPLRQLITYVRAAAGDAVITKT